ncbi:hypothetical protein DY000_02026110 [Brassica cretica]|uniref:Uncharacterized protein n=1 Tax=Brassica cretica TaxID=69181 RepID=A0ABQ7EBN2_BRACR|nr:hypothetical protein DY000_02026110 [Brassica cretica]
MGRAEDGERPFITFKYHISGQEEGYPGAVSNTPTYILMSETTMELNMEASAENKNTPINLAQNTYWNLADNDSWNILDHMIQIWGPHITHVDQHTDHARSLRERDFLSLSPQEIGESTGEVGIGYDHNYVLDCPDQEKDGLKHATKLKDDASEQVVLHGCGLGN